MSVKTATSRFIYSSLRAGFYQQLLKSGFQQLGYGLVRGIETAQICRQGDRVIELASVLDNFPTKEHHLIGQYYKAWLGQKIGQDARPTFERIAEESLSYKTRALISLAAIEARKGNFDEGLRYYKEASKTANNHSLIVEISRDIALVRSNEGDHKQAVKEFEKALPLIKHADPFYYYQFLNSFAVELIEVGRLEEACNMSNIVLASSYAFAYPEWRETREDIAFRGYRSRSVISFSPVLSNVVLLPERSSEQKSVNKPGKILSYTDWKKKMVEESDDDAEIGDLEGLSENDLMVKLLYLATHKGVSAKKLRKIILYAQEVFSEPED